jgi:signal transduction histidine kinase
MQKQEQYSDLDRLTTGLIIIKLNQNELSAEFINLAAISFLNLDLANLNQHLNAAAPLRADLANLEVLFRLISQQDGSGDGRKKFDLRLAGQYFAVTLSKNANQYWLEFSVLSSQDLSQTTHELKRPLQNIKALTETLILGAKNEPELLDKYLCNINNEVDRLAKLVEDLLSISHLSSNNLIINKVTLPLKELIQELFTRVNTESKNIHLIDKVASDFTVQADKDLLKHLLENLIDNAVKYNVEGGSVTVSTLNRKGSKGFSITDTGLGINLEEQEKIFTPFFRSKSVQSIAGTGLGLSIVRNIADLHGWQIKVESGSGGTSFLVLTDS